VEILDMDLKDYADVMGLACEATAAASGTA
jgi:hypothetical protein